MNTKNYIPPQGSALHFTVDAAETYAVVHLAESSIEFFNTAAILGFLEKVLSDLGNPTTVLDMTNVTAMDSSGIGMLITLHKRLRETGHHLLLVNVTESVVRIFKLTSMSAFLKTFPSMTDIDRFVAGNQGI